MNAGLKISAVITNYETWSLSRDGVLALQRFAPSIRDIVVVDDGSTTSAPAGMAELCTLILSGKNRGYVASVNIGVARTTGDLVVLLDSDAVVVEDFTSTAEKMFASNPDLGAVGIRTVDKTGMATGVSQPEPTLVGFIAGQRLEQRLDSVTWKRRRQVCFSCAMVVRRAAFEDINGFDEGFDFLDADIDFSMRLQDAGWTLGWIDGGHVRHEGGGSPQGTTKRVMRFHFNRWRLLRKHHRVKFVAVSRAALFTRHLLEYAIARLLGGVLLDRERAAEKAESRKNLMRSVWDDYRT